jgi:hypothetical protein
MGKAEYGIAHELQDLAAADREVEPDLPRSAPASNRS